jgi:hypothetical protein
MVMIIVMQVIPVSTIVIMCPGRFPMYTLGILRFRIDALERGRNQPFYTVLAEDGSSRCRLFPYPY